MRPAAGLPRYRAEVGPDASSKIVNRGLRGRVVSGLRQLRSQTDFEYRAGQHNVIEDMERFFIEGGNKGYVEMPTGSGKTVMFGRLIASHDIRTLVLVPTRQLVEQTISELQLQGIEHVAEAYDERTVSRSQLEEPSRVLVATYAAFVKASKEPWGRYKIEPETFGMVILDEAHHAKAEGTSRALENFDHAFQVGFSATPDYSEERQLRKLLPTRIHKLSIAEAIELGLITQYATTLLVTNADMSHVRLRRDDYDSVQLDEAINTDPRNIAIAEFFAQNFPEKRAVFSCNSIAHSNDMAERLRQQGVRALAVHGQLPKDELRAALNLFKGGFIDVLCNNKLLTEGFDETNIDVVVNVSPTHSIVRQVQRTGRGLRVNKRNPSKQLVVVECIDTGYAKRPVLFSDTVAAGAIRSDNIFPSTDHELNAIARENEQGLTFLIKPADIQAYINAMPPLVINSKDPKPKTAPSSPPAPRPKAEMSEERKEHMRTGHNALVLYLLGDKNEDDVAWQNRGLCAQTDPEAFFPEKGGSTREAKKICLACEVRGDCLEYALMNEERFGIWGGLSERERRKLKKRSQKVATAALEAVGV